ADAGENGERAGAVGLAAHGDAVADSGLHALDVGDDADGTAAGAELAELGEDELERFRVEGAEALVDEEGAEVDAPGLGGDDVGEAKCEAQGRVERLAAGQGLGVTLGADAVIEDAQGEPELAAALAFLLGAADELVAAHRHGLQPVV